MIKVIFYILYFIFIPSFQILNAASLDINERFISVAAIAKPAVVNIFIYKESEKKRAENYSKIGFGSGTIISGKGYIATNYHVLKKGSFYRVILYDGKECQPLPFSDGELFKADEKTDIAILKINENEIYHIKPISFEESNDLSEGEWVIAIGNPYGLRQSVTCGIVSSKGRSDIGFAEIEDFIQTDVSINPGNSGGPLINLNGKLVGINTAIRTRSGGYQGISFAIPSKIIKQVCSELLKYGRVRRGWLGFLAQERAVSSGGEKKFLEIISVIKNSPAEISGIQKGDIIKEINGKAMSTLGELINFISNKPIGSDLNIGVSRDGRIYGYNLILREKDTHKKIQNILENIFFNYGMELDVNSMTGDVVISYLSPMGIAYQSGLKKGDIILSLNGNEVSRLEDFIKLYSKYDNIISRMEILRNKNKYSIEFLNE
ncbi:MAG: trypsin-like peptidase domain-containing protein [Spirochaetes bacterium]|nr:trypsin-like peptidase domain-containing protein [Spirochaetota bacterium]